MSYEYKKYQKVTIGLDPKSFFIFEGFVYSLREIGVERVVNIWQYTEIHLFREGENHDQP